jgi:DNA-binding MarR family transcriptional regulator
MPTGPDADDATIMGEVAPEPDANAVRIGAAWRELRRGAAMSVLRPLLFGDGEDALEPGQYDTLDLLVRADAWRMSALAEALRVDPSTATRAIQRLTRLGLVERTNCTQDGRVVLVRASETGRTRHAAIVRHRRRVMEAVLAPFSDAEQAQLADLLDRMVGAMDAFADELIANGVEATATAG